MSFAVQHNYFCALKSHTGASARVRAGPLPPSIQRMRTLETEMLRPAFASRVAPEATQCCAAVRERATHLRGAPARAHFTEISIIALVRAACLRSPRARPLGGTRRDESLSLAASTRAPRHSRRSRCAVACAFAALMSCVVLKPNTLTVWRVALRILCDMYTCTVQSE